MLRRSFLPVPLLAAVPALLAGCASGPRTIEIPQHQLQAALARRVASETRPAGMFNVRVAQPRLQLLPESNRLRVDFSVELSHRLAPGLPRSDLGVSFGLRYAAADATLRATDVRVERIDLNGLPEAVRAPLQMAGALVAENLLEDMVLHAFQPEDFARARGWTPGAIRVTATGVRIELLPPVARLS